MGEFIYQRSVAPCGVAVEEIYGAEEKSAKVWKLFAMQIFSESAGDYRSIVHLDNGAPLLEDVPQRISVSHTPHYLVVASIPKTPDINLEEFNIRTAIGIDIEKADRSQVLKVRDKFLSEDEQKLLPPVSDTTTDDHQPTTDNRQPTTDNSLVFAMITESGPELIAMTPSPEEIIRRQEESIIEYIEYMRQEIEYAQQLTKQLYETYQISLSHE